MSRNLFDVMFENSNKSFQPLAERVRPSSIAEIKGQDHILGHGKPLRELVKSGRCPSIILWGPPGCGKTTLARLLSKLVNSEFIQLSAVTSGVKELKETFEAARMRRIQQNRGTLLFIDEIHRFNKAQQDALLPHIEEGIVTFVGATTENPSFEVISALLSRCQVLTLNPLSFEDILVILQNALDKDEILKRYPPLEIEKVALEKIAQMSAGDARIALNYLEICCETARLINADSPKVTESLVNEAFQKKAIKYDKNGEEHYNLISALHKSMRGSDPDASLYWLYRMIEGGEDCRFILRRMLRFAAEDVGMAEPFALTLAVSAAQAFDYVGPPEGYLFLAQLAVYLAVAPKSNSLYLAEKNVKEEIQSGREPTVPLHLRNAPTKLMKELDYSKGYKYPHDFPNGFIRENYFPEGIGNCRYYYPKSIGREKQTLERLKQLWPERFGESASNHQVKDFNNNS